MKKSKVTMKELHELLVSIGKHKGVSVAEPGAVQCGTVNVGEIYITKADARDEWMIRKKLDNDDVWWVWGVYNSLALYMVLKFALSVLEINGTDDYEGHLSEEAKVKIALKVGSTVMTLPDEPSLELPRRWGCNRTKAVVELPEPFVALLSSVLHLSIRKLHRVSAAESLPIFKRAIKEEYHESPGNVRLTLRVMQYWAEVAIERGLKNDAVWELE